MMNTVSRKLAHFTRPTTFDRSLPTKTIGLAVTSFVMSLSMTGLASAAAIRTGFSTGAIAASDDNSTGLVNLGFTANFFGTNYTQTYVNNNGNLTFNTSLSSYSPFGLSGVTRAIIAPFFADVDTRIGIDGVDTRNPLPSPVTYGTGTVDGRNAFGANYINVAYYKRGDKFNDFQVVLIDRADTGAGNFDIEFNYDRIQWETGNDSNGSNGLGGSSASVGYSNGLSGAANVSLELPGSRVNGALLDGGSNSLVANSFNSDGVAGRYVFNARNGVVTNPLITPTTSVPEPLTIVGTLMGAGAALRIRKRLKVTNKL